QVEIAGSHTVHCGGVRVDVYDVLGDPGCEAELAYLSRARVRRRIAQRPRVVARISTAQRRRTDVLGRIDGRRSKQLSEAGCAHCALVTAAEAQATRHRPVETRLVGAHTAGDLVVRVAIRHIEIELPKDSKVAHDRNERFAEYLVHLVGTTGRPGGLIRQHGPGNALTVR